MKESEVQHSKQFAKAFTHRASSCFSFSRCSSSIICTVESMKTIPFFYMWHPEMIKIRDGWCMIELLFLQMVHKALINTSEDGLWENVWSYKLKYWKENNPRNGHTHYPNIHSQGHLGDHRYQSSKLFCFSYKCSFPIWGWIQLSFGELRPLTPRSLQIH